MPYTLITSTALLLLSGLAGWYLAPNPTISATVMVTVIAIWWLLRLDGWQRLYAVTLILLLCAESSQEGVASAVYYIRYVAAGALACWTWYQPHDQPRRVLALSMPARLLIRGLWLSVAVATLSSIWSVDMLRTIQQSIALTVLAIIVHGLLTRRWTSPERILMDLRVAFVVLTAAFVASIAADWYGVSNTRVFSGRFQGLFSNPNMLGITCALAFPIGWALYRSTRNVGYLWWLTPATVALLMSQSRTAIVAIALGAAWVIIRMGTSVILRAAIAVPAAYLVLESVGVTRRLAAGLFQDLTLRFSSGGQTDQLSGRILAWQETLDLLGARPVTGYGYSAGPQLFASMRGAGLLGFQRDVVHNSYLQWLLELGLVGAVPLAMLLAATVWTVLRSNMRDPGAGLIWLTLTGLLLHVTESAMFGTGQVYPYIFWLAVAGTLATQQVSYSRGAYSAILPAVQEAASQGHIADSSYYERFAA